MKLLLERKWLSATCTIGTLSVDGKFFCYTLEDVVRTGAKVAGQTAIPEGTYTVIIDNSARFKRKMPHVLNVPNFEGIRIHSGNTDKDTEGCILVGDAKHDDRISNSRAAFNRLFPLLQKADSISITILKG